MKTKFKQYLMLFATFFKIGLFTFGGGYAMISLIETETVERKKWIAGPDLLNIIAIAESTPGPIAINSATFIGYRVAGVLGSAFATLGVVLPSFVIIFAISFFVQEFLALELVSRAFKGIQAAVTILILRAGLKMIKNLKKNVLSLVIATLSLAATVVISLFDFNFSSVFIILIGAVIGLTYYSITDRKERAPAEGDSQSAITEASVNTQGLGNDQENRSNESSSDEDRAAIEEKEDRQ